jgi:hypothetical protein
MGYLLQWAHAYVVHFGGWVAMLVAFAVYKDGLPEPKRLPSLFKSAVALAFFASFFSSHAQHHLISHFLAK